MRAAATQCSTQDVNYACVVFDNNMADILQNDLFDEESVDEEEILLFLLLLRRRRRRLRASNRKTWTKQWILRRKQQGACNNLIRELSAEDPESFRQYHRLT